MCEAERERGPKSFRHHSIRVGSINCLKDPSIVYDAFIQSQMHTHCTLCTLDHGNMVSMAIAPTVSQTWRCTPMHGGREWASISISDQIFIWSDLGAVIKIYWPRSMCQSIQFDYSIWILLLCVLPSHNHHKLQIWWPKLQKRLLLL